MPKDTSIKKALVIGSGPIVIGQAAEFDYAGAQACQSLREEGVSVVLMNSNPATIMTDTEMADRVYIEPLTVEFAERVIARERPDGLVATLGGQTGLKSRHADRRGRFARKVQSAPAWNSTSRHSAGGGSGGVSRSHAGDWRTRS